jgi:hypothetical protein
MKNVLVDTSVWVAHFREHNPNLVHLLHQGRVLIHPMVLGELACGTPPERTSTLANLSLLQQTQVATIAEVLVFIEQEKLYGMGCGLVDVQLLASTLITPNTELWTLDQRLASMAKRLGALHHPTFH